MEFESLGSCNWFSDECCYVLTYLVYALLYTRACTSMPVEVLIRCMGGRGIAGNIMYTLHGIPC